MRVGFKLAHLWSLALYGNTQAVAPDEALVRVAGVSCERRRLWVWPSHVGEDRGLPPARGDGDVGDAGGATHFLFATREGQGRSVRYKGTLMVKGGRIMVLSYFPWFSENSENQRRKESQRWGFA